MDKNGRLEPVIPQYAYCHTLGSKDYLLEQYLTFHKNLNLWKGMQIEKHSVFVCDII